MLQVKVSDTRSN